ncbi:MAG: prepilin-type N-terminal cleavage/methylation domain-containing protein [Verrucomicrobiales bacterium]|jgi:prepilin-type N-terminal cleavage/methylation domain-containing protein
MLNIARTCSLKRFAFSLTEVLMAVAVIGILTTAAISLITGTSKATQDRKLVQDVAVINAAVSTFIANGGTLEGADTAADVLERVKSRVEDDQSDQLVGVRAGLLDPRIATVDLPLSEEKSDSPRAIWDASRKRFIIRFNGASGIKKFVLDESRAADDTEHEHERNLTVAYSKKGDSKWIWDFRNFHAESSGPDKLIGQSPSGFSDPLELDPPTLSLPGDIYALTDYEGMTVTLSNPNPQGSSTLRYSIIPGIWENYTDPIPLTPGSKLETQSITLNPISWVDSSMKMDRYSTTPVKLKIDVEFTNTIYNYVTLGGALEPGSYPPQVHVSPGISTLVNGNSIPDVFINSNVFEIRWSSDGSSPAGSGATVGASFSGGFPGQEIPVWLGNWGSGDTIDVNVYAQSKNSAIVTDSDPVTRSIIATRIALPAPVIDLRPNAIEYVPPVYDATISLQTDLGNMPLGARIFYTTDGSDPGIAPDGEPVRGIPYTGTFQIPPDILVSARVYAPLIYKQWFLPSELATKAVEIVEFFDLPLEPEVLIVIDASGSMNAHFTGNLNRFERVIQEVIDTVDSLAAYQKFNVVTFNGGIHWSDGDTVLKPATAANKQSVRDALVDLHARGSTNYEIGLRHAISITDRPLTVTAPPKQIVFLSDGRPNKQNYLDEVDALVALGIRVDTIGIGNFQSQAPLQQLATMTGGSYRFVSKPGSAGTLDEPRFSIRGNDFNHDDFPLAMALINPNSEPSSLIRYSINGGAFAVYSAPFSVGYDEEVTAYCDSSDQSWAPSSIVSETYYVNEYRSQRPAIALSATTFTDTTPEITVTLTNNNPTGLTSVIYWFGTQSEADATPYTRPFTLAASDWNNFAGEALKDVAIFTRTLGKQTFVTNSTIEDKEIENKTSAFLQQLKKDPLNRPSASPKGDEFDYTEFPFTVTLLNPNASGQLNYSLNGGKFRKYETPISVTWDTEISFYVKAGNGDKDYRDSAVDTHLYEAESIQLDRPSIRVSGQDFSPSIDTITVTLTDRNSASFSSLVWWFDGQDEALATPYTGPFTLTAAEWETYLKDGKHSAKLLAKAVGSESFIKKSRSEDIQFKNSR